jgi:hypothetical protein
VLWAGGIAVRDFYIDSSRSNKRTPLLLTPRFSEVAGRTKTKGNCYNTTVSNLDRALLPDLVELGQDRYTVDFKNGKSIGVTFGKAGTWTRL